MHAKGLVAFFVVLSLGCQRDMEAFDADLAGKLHTNILDIFVSIGSDFLGCFSKWVCNAQGCA